MYLNVYCPLNSLLIIEKKINWDIHNKNCKCQRANCNFVKIKITYLVASFQSNSGFKMKQATIGYNEELFNLSFLNGQHIDLLHVLLKLGLFNLKTCTHIWHAHSCHCHCMFWSCSTCPLFLKSFLDTCP